MLLNGDYEDQSFSVNWKLNQGEIRSETILDPAKRFYLVSAIGVQHSNDVVLRLRAMKAKYEPFGKKQVTGSGKFTWYKATDGLLMIPPSGSLNLLANDYQGESTEITVDFWAFRKFPAAQKTT